MTVSHQRILIYAINGKGMGHLNRTLVLAQAARDNSPETAILFAVASPLFWLVRDAGFEVLKVPDRNHALGFHVGRESRPRHLSALFEPILDQYRPTALVVDMTLNASLFHAASQRGAKVAVVLRKQRATRLAAKLDDPAINLIDRFLIPHSVEEFPLEEMPSSWRERARRLGPVARSLQVDLVAGIRARYSTSNRPLIVVTIGGGGFAESHETLIAAEQAATASRNELDWVLVYGPYYPHELPANGANVQRTKFEANLRELCAAADIVVCNAGYNTIQELAVAGTPAVVIPLKSTVADDQYERAALLVESGSAVLGKADGPDLLKQIRELLVAAPAMRRQPAQGEPSVELGERFLHALR